ncbi:MAG: YggT family protein [Limnochordales bacterium]|nr:YggT family protein [Limnochordales bacterium]
MIPLIRLVNTLFDVYSWLLIARILLSWLPVDPYNPAVRFIARVTEPYLRLFRGLLPPVGALDLSPIIALLVLNLARRLAINLLWALRF